MINHQRQIAHHAQSLAGVLRGRADEMEAYATALAQDPSLMPRLAAPYGAVESVIQILAEVDQRNRPADTYQFTAALYLALADSQRNAQEA